MVDTHKKNISSQVNSVLLSNDTLNKGAFDAIELHLTGRKSRVAVKMLEPGRILAAKAAFTVRNVLKGEMKTLVSGNLRPRAGDIVLARVERIRQHKRIDLPTGRKALLNPGDEIILVCGNRYATDQFEAFIPQKLGRAHLVASGGVAGIVAERALKMKSPTEIMLLGLIGNEAGLPLNLASFALPIPNVTETRSPVIAVLGASMNSGKTTTARFLIRGLKAAGFRPGYVKLTGTGAGNDYWAMVDSGAYRVVDFTDAGLVSTYKAPIQVIENISLSLIGHLCSEGCDRIVAEVADGLLQSETDLLLHSDVFHTLVDRVAFAAGDAIAARSGVRMLQDLGFDVACVSGCLTTSPLSVREAIDICGVPVLSTDDLSNPTVAAEMAASSTVPHKIVRND